MKGMRAPVDRDRDASGGRGPLLSADGQLKAQLITCLLNALGSQVDIPEVLGRGLELVNPWLSEEDLLEELLDHGRALAAGARVEGTWKLAPETGKRPRPFEICPRADVARHAVDGREERGGRLGRFVKRPLEVGSPKLREVLVKKVPFPTMPVIAKDGEDLSPELGVREKGVVGRRRAFRGGGVRPR